MKKFHPSIDRIGLSKIVEISQRARKLAPDFEARTGKPFIYFQRGELDLHMPEYVKKTLKDSLDIKARTNYPKSGGEDVLKDSIISYHNEYGTSLAKNNIVTTYGGQGGLQITLSLFRGSGALGFNPCWSPILQSIGPYTETNFNFVPLKNEEGKITFDENELEEKLKTVDIFYFNNPHNPTGKVFTREEVERIDFLCRKHDVFLLSDEPYRDIVFDGKKHFSVAELENPNAVTSYTFSKSFAATGLRVGYAVSKNPKIIEAMSRVDYTQTAGVHTPTQYAFAEALSNKEEREKWLSSCREEFQARRDIMYDTLSPILGGTPKPEGAFYFFPDLRKFFPYSTNVDAEMLEVFLNNGVAIVPGSEFGKGNEGKARFSFSGTNRELTKIGSERTVNLLCQNKTNLIK